MPPQSDRLFMNYFLRKNKVDFRRWYERIVPFSMSELKRFDHGRSIFVFREDYENALRVKQQLYAIRASMDDKHTDYLDNTLIKRNPSNEQYLVERELYNDIYAVWKAVCFPKDRPQLKTIDPVLLGGLLRTERMQKNIPAKHVAELVGISEKTLYSYEDGIRMVRVDVFYKMCQIYKIDLDITLSKAIPKWFGYHLGF